MAYRISWAFMVLCQLLSHCKGSYRRSRFESRLLVPEYDQGTEFETILKRRLNENDAAEGNTHSHIVAVNEAHAEILGINTLKKSAIPDTGNNEAIEEDLLKANKGDLGLTEGDMLLDKDDLAVVNHKKHETQLRRRKRNVIRNRRKLWPRGIVPFFIDSSGNQIKHIIFQAMLEIQKYTCIRFYIVKQPWRFRGNCIKIFRGPGCWSPIGRAGGIQQLSLGRGCEYRGVIMHEIMHALGIFHEQSRYDRDRFVQVLWSNILPNQRHNFAKYGHGSLDTVNLAYDYDSVMHYDRFSFTKRRGMPTIIARGNPRRRLGGQARGKFTRNDVKEIRALYNCR